MGNEIGKGGQMSPLGIRAVAYTTNNIEKKELTQLTEFVIASWKEAGYSQGKINPVELDAAIKSVPNFGESDVELLTRLFVMFDVSGEASISFKEYIAGVAGCLINGSTAEKLQIALSLYMIADGKDGLLKGDLKKALYAIIDSVSYFGDPVVSKESIDLLVNDVYRVLPNPSAPVSCDECVNGVMAHSLLEIFLSGRGKVLFGMKQ